MTLLILSLLPSWAELQQKFYNSFIKNDNWQYLWKGLGNTLRITVFALMIGIALGAVTAAVRATYDMTKGERRRGIRALLLRFADWICRLYVTCIRGIPVMVQLLIVYFVIFASVTVDKTFAAVLAFGVNSGAYSAEIFRAGIMSIEKGQFEAGRSLGFNYVQTMAYIIMPQAFKNILPALGNELIALLKETSISGYIALNDLTRGAMIILSITYDAFMPLTAIALIYLALVMLLASGVKRLERRLRSSEH